MVFLESKQLGETRYKKSCKRYPKESMLIETHKRDTFTFYIPRYNYICSYHYNCVVTVE